MASKTLREDPVASENGAGTALAVPEDLAAALGNLNAVLQGDEELSEVEQLVQQSELSEELIFERIKMAAGGATNFQRSDGETVRQLKGIIVSYQTTRGYWESEQLGKPPFCSSQDGIIGEVSGDIHADSERVIAANDHAIVHPFASHPTNDNRRPRCRQCILNSWGTDHKGRAGKACKETRRVMFLETGKRIPVLLTLPPTSLRPWKEFDTKMKSEKRANWAVRCRITVRQEKSDFTFGVVELEKIEDLDVPEIKAVLQAQKAYTAYLRDLDVTSEDYAEGNGQTIDGDVVEDGAPFQEVPPF